MEGVMSGVIGVMKKVGMQNCILVKHQSDCIQCKKYSETVVVTGGAIDVGYDPTDPDAKWTKSSY
jgi:hypothetical protein